MVMDHGIRSVHDSVTQRMNALLDLSVLVAEHDLPHAAQACVEEADLRKDVLAERAIRPDDALGPLQRSLFIPPIHKTERAVILLRQPGRPLGIPDGEDLASHRPSAGIAVVDAEQAIQPARIRFGVIVDESHDFGACRLDSGIPGE
ncbi:hypothetical protein D3C86_1275440 [compost metagenome]